MSRRCRGVLSGIASDGGFGTVLDPHGPEHMCDTFVVCSGIAWAIFCDEALEEWNASVGEVDRAADVVSERWDFVVTVAGLQWSMIRHLGEMSLGVIIPMRVGRF